MIWLDLMHCLIKYCQSMHITHTPTPTLSYIWHHKTGYWFLNILRQVKLQTFFHHGVYRCTDELLKECRHVQRILNFWFFFHQRSIQICFRSVRIFVSITPTLLTGQLKNFINHVHDKLTRIIFSSILPIIITNVVLSQS